MRGYVKELKLVPNGADIFYLWVSEDGKKDLYIGKIEFEAEDAAMINYCRCLLGHMKDFNY